MYGSDVLALLRQEHDGEDVYVPHHYSKEDITLALVMIRRLMMMMRVLPLS